MTAALPTHPRDLARHLAAAVGVSVGLVHQLHELHSQQWALEDATRYINATAEQVAAAKAAIDSCNSRRHRLVDAIDASLGYASGTDAVRHYSETVGELCDRLLIIDLKLAAATDADPSPSDTPATQRIQGICAHLSVHVAELLNDMAARRAVLPPRVGLKIYRPEGAPRRPNNTVPAASMRH